MAIAGSNVWAMRVRVCAVDGNMYLVTGERSYRPGNLVYEPAEVVVKLQEDMSQEIWLRLLGMNSSEVRDLWVNRDKTKDTGSPSEPK